MFKYRINIKIHDYGIQFTELYLIIISYAYIYIISIVNYIIFQVTKNTQKLYTQFQTQKYYNNTRALLEKKLIYQIKEKLVTNNAIIVKFMQYNILSNTSCN